MPPFATEALLARGLMPAYSARPAYQQNDYIGWIIRAKREDTRQKRLGQMLDELASGDRYMNMPYRLRDEVRQVDERLALPPTENYQADRGGSSAQPA